MAKVQVLEKNLSEKVTEILKLKGVTKFGETSNEDATYMDKEDSVSDQADVSEFDSSFEEVRSKKKKKRFDRESQNHIKLEYNANIKRQGNIYKCELCEHKEVLECPNT